MSSLVRQRCLHFPLLLPLLGGGKGKNNKRKGKENGKAVLCPFRRTLAEVRTLAGSALAVEVPNPTMSAGVLQAKSTESLEDSLPLSVSSVVLLVKPDMCSKRVLLLASETVFELEARAVLEDRRRGRESSFSFELDLTLCNNFFRGSRLVEFFRQGILTPSTHLHLQLRGHGRAILALWGKILCGLVRPLSGNHPSHRQKARKFVMLTLFWNALPGVLSKHQIALSRLWLSPSFFLKTSAAVKMVFPRYVRYVNF